MNKKLILNLLASSSIFTSLMSTLGIINPAHASVNLNQRLMHTSDGRTCITNLHGLKDSYVFEIPREIPRLLLHLSLWYSQHSHLIAKLQN